jgi:hypothetical protein
MRPGRREPSRSESTTVDRPELLQQELTLPSLRRLLGNCCGWLNMPLLDA